MVVAISQVVIRSEGQARFLQVTGSLAAIAARLTMRSPQSIADWRSGRKVPSPEARARIEGEFGIDAALWDVRPGADTEEIADCEVGATSLDDCINVLKTIQRESKRDGLLAAERVKLADAEARILTLRARLEAAAELSEDRYVRDHPAFRRFCDLVIEALRPHPAAAKAVHEAIQRAMRVRDEVNSS